MGIVTAVLLVRMGKRGELHLQGWDIWGWGTVTSAGQHQWRHCLSYGLHINSRLQTVSAFLGPVLGARVRICFCKQ